MKNLLLLMILGGAVSACASQKPSQPEVLPGVDVGQGWSDSPLVQMNAGDLDPAVLATWWKEFDDPILDGLIESATTANLDLRTAQAQLRRARAERKSGASRGKPNVGGSAGATTSGALDNVGSTTELFSAGLDAGWELDLFGGIASAKEATELDFQAAQEARRDVLISVLAEVALNYTELRTSQARLSVAEGNLELLSENLRLLNLQEESGMASALDVAQATSNVEQTRASIPSMQNQEQQLKNRLAVLLGRTPGSLNSLLAPQAAGQVPTIHVAIGVPAQVLRRRPDVRRAERQLAAESARVGVAMADLYPKFSLGGTIGLESLSLSDLFQAASGVFGLGPRVSFNLFDGGKARQQLEIQNALQEQALIAYEASILMALEDVENAISGFATERMRYNSLELSAGEAKKTLDLAQIRFDAGETSFLQVLDAQRSLLGVQDSLAQSNGQIQTNLIRLYKALGGGWTPEEN